MKLRYIFYISKYISSLKESCRKLILFLRQDFLIKMAESIENSILGKIKKARGGSLFFTEDFLLQ